MVAVCFFFFRQKTAYEMRISDWSSDVCSSDLHQAYIARDTEIGRGPGNAKIAGPFRFQTHSRDIDLIVCADRDIEIPGNGHATPGLRIARYDFPHGRSEEHTSELQSLMRISYAVFCLKKKTNTQIIQ